MYSRWDTLTNSIALCLVLLSHFVLTLISCFLSAVFLSLTIIATDEPKIPVLRQIVNVVSSPTLV